VEGVCPRIGGSCNRASSRRAQPKSQIYEADEPFCAEARRPLPGTLEAAKLERVMGIERGRPARFAREGAALRAPFLKPFGGSARCARSAPASPASWVRSRRVETWSG